jgi:hypothetical protein
LADTVDCREHVVGREFFVAAGCCVELAILFGTRRKVVLVDDVLI